MPGKNVDCIAEQSCRRCRENDAALLVRTEPLCRDCFIKYVHTKVIKRMESFRVRNSAPDQQRKILLPVSFGVSSLSLLNILDYHLKTQTSKTGRTGYALTLLFLDTSSVEKAAPDKALLSHLQERFPDYQYVTVPLQKVIDVGADDAALSDTSASFKIRKDTPAIEQLSRYMESLTSATARADVIPIMRTRLIVEEAKRLGCEGILWGDSTTRLAEKTLAETAKGRGFSLPWQMADGESPFGITFHYPLRDVLRKELTAYIDLSEPSIKSLVHKPSGTTQASISSKNTTIDDLMKQYFESVEENFPSIVSNVVRTTSKLEVAQVSESDPRCSLCKMPVADGRFGIHGWGGDQQDGLEPLSSDTQKLCYGCTRSIPRRA